MLIVVQEEKQMKQTKLLVLTAMSALLLTGCDALMGGNSAGKLPSGGKTEDLSTEEGQATLKARLASTTEAYKGLEFNALSLDASSSFSLNGSVKANLNGFGDFNLSAGINNFNTKSSLVAAKDEDGKVAASYTASTTSGTVSLKGTVPGTKEGTKVNVSSSASISGAKAGAYLKGDKLYVSADGNKAVASNIDKFANKLVEDLSKDEGYVSLLNFALANLDFVENGKFNIAGLYENEDKKVYQQLDEAIDWPVIEEEAEEIDEDDIEDAVEEIDEIAAKDLGFEFKTYSNNGYGLSFALNKDRILKLIEDEEDKEGFAEYVSKLELKASVYFNKNYLLESIGFSYNVSAKLDKGILDEDDQAKFEEFSAEISSKGSFELDVKYNQGTVSYPSDLDEYVENHKEVSDLSL